MRRGRPIEDRQIAEAMFATPRPPPSPLIPSFGIPFAVMVVAANALGLWSGLTFLIGFGEILAIAFLGSTAWTYVLRRRVKRSIRATQALHGIGFSEIDDVEAPGSDPGHV